MIRLLAGELDVAAVLLPEGRTAPPPLLTNIIARDRMEIVQGAAGNLDGDWKSLGRTPWVLNPPGCFLRASLIDRPAPIRRDSPGWATRSLGEGRRTFGTRVSAPV